MRSDTTRCSIVALVVGLALGLAMAFTIGYLFAAIGG